ncbi:VOC family protein [Haloferax sp. DFSO60]|uniref:VOC family protein n=1 Tax=Haloferax sp. DFSO60 TaxID=3388652 RepID=UPI00397B8D4D
MPIRGLHHLVLLVDGVPEGETYYRELFDMEVLFREGTVDEEPGTLPDGLAWSDAISQGVEPTMTFLGRDDFFLAVAQSDGECGSGRFDHLALAVSETQFEAITERATDFGCAVSYNASHHRTFEDRFGIEWELNAKPRPPEQAFDTLDIVE